MLRSYRSRRRLPHLVLLLAITLVARSAPAESDIIQRENQKPGTRDWLLKNLQPVEAKNPNDQYQRRRAVEGYCSHASIRAGERLSIYVSTNPVSQFKADIYRLGYYNGSGARLVLSVGPLQGVAQPDPADGPKNLIECKWKPSFTLDIPDDWLSGVYLGKLTAIPSGHESYVVFIVRDDRRADLLFQCSDITWQSSNRWPAWRSLYDVGSKQWHTSPGNDVGFDRPYSIYFNPLPSNFNPLSNGSGEFLLWEFPLAFWLEQHGYDVTYISNLDTHSDPKSLLRAQGFLSVGHDEYWTQQMMDNVAKARDAGVNLAFLSGNSVDGKIYLKESTDGRLNRVFGRIGQFEDEQKLMGASSYGVGTADWTCVKPDHWIFEGTGMKHGDSIPKLVGWEYHGQPLADHPGLVVLATGSVRGGSEGPRTYAATIYPGPKNNFVFNAATCWWNMPLSNPPGFTNPARNDFSKPDPRVQRITKNLLDRMIAGRGV